MLLSFLRPVLNLNVFRITSRPLRAQPYCPTGIRIRSAEETEMLRYCGEPEMHLPEGHVRAAFARGDLCAVAFHGSRLVGYEWFAHGRTPHIDSVWVEFDTSARYAYKQFVHPQYRGRRVAAGLSTCLDNWYRRSGCTRAISMIDLGNGASWRSEARTGARTAGYAAYVLWFGRCITARTPGAREFKLRLYSSADRSQRYRHARHE